MMKFKTFILLVSILISGAMLLEGCLDVPVVPKGNITGTVYNEYGIPVSGSYVSIGDYPIAESDNSGNFTIDKIISPYDLTLGSSFGGVKYLTLKAPTSILYNNFEGYAARVLPVKVTFSHRNISKMTFIKFISSDLFWQENSQITPFDTIFHQGTDSIWNTDIIVPLSKNTISGKILYLEATCGPEGYNISSFDMYGIKNVSLNQYPPAIIHFSPEELINDPRQSDLNFNIIMPNNHLISYNTGCYIKFAGMNSGSDLELGFNEYDYSGTFEVPLLNGLNYKIKIVNSYINTSTQWVNSYGRKWETANVGENVTITHDNPIVQALPPNGKTNITDTSTFEISDPGEKGVYFYIFNDKNSFSRVTVITDKLSIKFSDIQSRVMSFRPNSSYLWSVLKYPKYTSIDDFVSVKYMEDDRYNSIPSSATFKFTTGP